MKVLGLDTTADDTCAAVVADGKKIFANVVFSQSRLHEKYGGIVPQIASREHLKNILPVADEALNQAGLKLKNIDLISVGQSPDPALSYYHIGLTTAKSLAYVLKIPLVGVDHMEAHIFANVPVHPDLTFPFISLTAAGGHTILVLVKDLGRYKVLGSTRDDAAGEAFDKVARILGLGYPGGPAIDAAAALGNPKAFNFPRPMKNHKGFDFSYSGLKTAVYLQVKKMTAGGRKLLAGEVSDLAASFRAATVDSLLDKTFKACREFGLKRVVLGGGVAANDLIRAEADRFGREKGIDIFYPPKNLCTDNAVGTATLGYHQFKKKGPDDLFKLSYFRKSPLESW